MSWESTLDEWAIAKRKALPARIRRLIAMASFDLWYGPLSVGHEEDDAEGNPVKWPGFQSACKEISNALDDLKTDVWIDTFSGEVMESEPQGFYDENPDEEGEEEVWVEPNWEDIFHVNSRTVLAHIVADKELADLV